MLDLFAKRFVIFPLLALLVFTIAVSEPRLRGARVTAIEQQLTTPPKLLKFFTFGHRRSLSALLWLHVLTWTGERYLKDKTGFLSQKKAQDYLFEQTKFIVQLDPSFYDPYRFTALSFMWYSKVPQRALPILERGMVEFPNEWELPFFYAFIHYYFLNDNATAAVFFTRAGKLPGSPAYFLPLAAKLQRESVGTAEALALVETLLRDKDNLPDQLFAALTAEQRTLSAIHETEQAVAKFKADHGRIPSTLDLVEEGYLPAIPRAAGGAPVQLGSDGKVTANVLGY